MILSACSSYDPTLYPGYDVLRPSEEVRKNPIGLTEEKDFIVNEAFLFWVFDLKMEIVRLRNELKEK